MSINSNRRLVKACLRYNPPGPACLPGNIRGLCARIEAIKRRSQTCDRGEIAAAGTLKFLAWASISFLLAIAANAGVGVNKGGRDTPGAVSRSATALAPCVDMNADCSTLMVNYYGDAVTFSLFRHGDAGATTGGDRTAGNDPNNKARPLEKLSSSEPPAADGNDLLLNIDFLRGFHGRAGDPAATGTQPGRAGGGTGSGGKHDWTLAAATSMDYTLQRSKPRGIAIRGHNGGGLQTFWEFEHVYRWEVEEDVLEDSKYDISQVLLSNVYISPKVDSGTDPKTVICDLNNTGDCRPVPE